MAAGLFTFEDALHTHLSIGFVEGCIACAQFECDMALSKAAYAAKLALEASLPRLTPVLCTAPAKRRVRKSRRNHTASSAA